MTSDKGRTPPPEAFPRRSPKILWRMVDGDAVLFHEDDGRAFALNETAALVWRMCDGRRSLADLSSRVAERSGFEDARTHDMVTALVEKLAEEGCIELADSPESDPRLAEPPGPPLDSLSLEGDPTVEEIVFAACDCTGGGRGTMRNAECVTVPRKQISTI